MQGAAFIALLVLIAVAIAGVWAVLPREESSGGTPRQPVPSPSLTDPMLLERPDERGPVVDA